MKHFIFFCFFFLLCYNLAEAQTNANVPSPANVLVVWNSSSAVSDSVQQYYVNARNIPASNIVPLYLPDTTMNINNEIRTINIAEGGNIIRDSLGHLWGSWFVTPHAWKYFYQYMAEPIKEHIEINELQDIRYIVLCKGVPYKIQAGGNFDITIGNLAVDGLLSMLNTDNYDNLLDAIYDEYRSYALPYPNYCHRCTHLIINPYYNADPYLNMNNRFKSGVFTQNWNGYTIKLDYLVSHLDGINYNMVKGMIDLSSEAIHSDNYDWFIDADPTPCHGYSIMVNFANSTASKLNSIGFSNYSFDTTEDTVTYHNKPVMSYSSNGIHTTKPPITVEGQTLHPDYIQSQLNFNYAPGAIFNTAESLNGWMLSSITRGPTPMGQVVEFFLEGGTLGVAHAYEPYVEGVIDDAKMLPSYQIGYPFIDAAYMGMQYLAWQSVVVGDPLTTIAWGKQAITDNLTLTGTNLVTGEITVPLVNSITLDHRAVVNFKHNGFITGDGYIYTVSSNYSLLINDWQKALFRSEEDNHPKLIWGAYPGIPSLIEGYKIYRKWESSSFELISLVDISTLEFIDEDYEIYNPEANENQKEAEYYITAIIENESSIVESDPSNVIDYWVNKAGKKGTSNIAELNYTIDQNYPNPFNPITQIKYSIKENGLVSIRVYDVLGKEVAVLIKEEQPAGEHRVNFDGSNLSSGIYFYTITAKDFHQTKKMLLVK
jgi:uncharacterized protein (TIGR03790 family)